MKKNWRHRIHDTVAQAKPLRLTDRLFRRRRAYAADVQRLAALLAYASEPVQPSHDLRAKVMAALQNKTDTSHTIVPSEQRRWKSLLPGIQICLLNEAAGHRSVLLTIKAGYALPAHLHERVEQAFVLEGSCLSGATPLKTGDFFLAQAGTTHEPVRAIEDCLLLVIAHQ